MTDGYCLYVHKNKSNGKSYVGITSQPPKQRWHGGSNYSQNQHFTRAIKKYGWDGFDHLIIKDNLSKEEACELEKYYIRELKSNDPEFGYNILDGGNISGGYNEEVARKMSLSAKARFSNQEERLKQSERIKKYFSSTSARSKNGLAQKHRFEKQEEREKDREAKRAIFQPVRQYSKDGEFIREYECLRDADKAGFNRSYIREAAKCGKLAYGYYWTLLTKEDDV
jgi:group I intron endonuclease